MSSAASKRSWAWSFWPATRGLGRYVEAIWLVRIAANLATMGHYFDIAIRDLIVAIAAFMLARLTEALANETTGDGVAGSAYRATKR